MFVLDDDVCNIGIHQSPLDLVTNYSVQAYMLPLQWEGYLDPRTEGFDLVNTGHTAEIHYRGSTALPWIAKGPLTDTYILEQIHFHWGGQNSGTEHAINGQRYSMEAHLVHFKEEYQSFDNAKKYYDGLVVVGILFSETATNNTDFNELIAGLANVHEMNESTILESNAMAWINPHTTSHSYFTYEGSLTTPPCSEIVTWIVLDEPGTIGSQQVEEFQKLEGSEGTEIDENVRPLQLVNGRHIYYVSGASIYSGSLSWMLMMVPVTLFSAMSSYHQ